MKEVLAPEKVQATPSKSDPRPVLAEKDEPSERHLDALERIEKGTYGICEVGNEEIEEDRLNANPAARTCKAHLN